jgi:hypothetical protein
MWEPVSRSFGRTVAGRRAGSGSGQKSVTGRVVFRSAKESPFAERKATLILAQRLGNISAWVVVGQATGRFEVATAVAFESPDNARRVTGDDEESAG